MAVISVGAHGASARNWRSIRVNITTVGTLILPARAGRVSLTLITDESAGDPVQIAIDGTSGVSVANNGRIVDGDGISIETTGPVYAIASAAIGASLYETWN